MTDSYDIAPDTYVKCYLRDGERWLLKKKTKVVRHSEEPQYNQTLKYQVFVNLHLHIKLMSI